MLKASTGTDPNPFRFGGQVGYYTGTNQGAYMNLIRCGSRWYDPEIGRWVSRDPVGYAGGANLFEYCHNNPVRFGDSEGEKPKPWYDRFGGWLNEKISNFGVWAFNGIIHLGGTVTMKPGTPTLQTPYLDRACPETYLVNGRYLEAGTAIREYIDQTGGQILLTVLLHKTGGRGGRLGGAPHRQVVDDILTHLRASGYTEYGREFYVKMTWRLRGRFADVWGKNPLTGQIELYQVGYLAADGTPVLREGKALSDLERAGYSIHFVPLNP